MAAVIGLAASATEATGERFGIFVGCQLAAARAAVAAVRAGPTGTWRRRARSSGCTWSAPRRARCCGRSPCSCRGPSAFALWAAAVLVEALVPLIATRRAGRRPAARRAPARAVRPVRDPGAGGVGGRRRARALRRRVGAVGDPGRGAVLRAGGGAVVELLRPRRRPRQAAAQRGRRRAQRPLARRVHLRPAAADPRAGDGRRRDRAGGRGERRRARCPPAPGCCWPAASRSTWSR